MKLLQPDELEATLREIGARQYHHLHPFHHLLHNGDCDKGQVQAWALNRYYYQCKIPQKDAALMAHCDDPDIRRHWLPRIIDHDGTEAVEGGISRWLKLTDALDLDRNYVISLTGILPVTRFAVDAYINFVKERTLLEAIASSLTELFSPQIIAERLSGMLKNYDFVDRTALAYFESRPPQAHRDVAFALSYVRQHARTPEQQRAVISALEFKCSVLWALLDGLYHAYVEPGHIPPGAFIPGEGHG